MQLPFLRIGLAAAATLILAGIVHLVSVVLLPQLATGHAAARLARDLPFNTFLTPETTNNPSGSIPFEDQTTRRLICRYSLQNGPVRIDVPTGEGFMSIVILQSDGRILTSMTDRVAQRRLISAVVGRPDQIAALEADDPDDDVPSDLRLNSASDEGVILVRAVIARATDAPVVGELLSQARCAPL
jgi:uncharacterized membrane protein